MLVLLKAVVVGLFCYPFDDVIGEGFHPVNVPRGATFLGVLAMRLKRLNVLSILSQSCLNMISAFFARSSNPIAFWPGR